MSDAEKKPDEAPDRDRELEELERMSRRGIFAALPRRSLGRVLMLLVAFAGVVYLQQRTHSIAGCMSDAFRVDADPSRPAARVRLAEPRHALDGGAP